MGRLALSSAALAAALLLAQPAPAEETAHEQLARDILAELDRKSVV